jgi:hypothetical protein
MPSDELPADPVRFIEREVQRPQGVPTPSDELPGLLHHYTSGHGLLGILSSGEFHCTNVLYMNDASEMDYGRTLVLKWIDDGLERARPDVAPYLTRIARMIEQPDFQYFVCCFCEKPDLLSQWRAYGAQAAGYSIGFSTDDLMSVLPEYSELVHVVYDPSEQQRMVRGALRRYVELAERCTAEYAGHERLDDALVRWAAAASNGLGRLIARMKSDAFAEEHEWRAVIIRFGFDTQGVRFRVTGNGMVIPYLPWTFKREGYKAVRQVRHGPTVNPTLAVQSVGGLLFNLGYRDVKVSGSSIPLRF